MEALSKQGDSLQSLEERIRGLEDELQKGEAREAVQKELSERDNVLEGMKERTRSKSEMESKLESRTPQRSELRSSYLQAQEPRRWKKPRKLRRKR